MEDIQELAAIETSEPPQDPQSPWLELPDGLSNQAKMFYWQLENARKDQHEGRHQACRDTCFALLDKAYLPKYARILALQLLAGVVSVPQAHGFLDEADNLCDQAQQHSGKKLSTVEQLRAETAEARLDIEQEAQNSGEDDDSSSVWLSDEEEEAEDVRGDKSTKSQPDPGKTSAEGVQPKKASIVIPVYGKNDPMPKGFVSAKDYVPGEPLKIPKPEFKSKVEEEEWRRDETEQLMEDMDLARNVWLASPAVPSRWGQGVENQGGQEGTEGGKEQEEAIEVDSTGQGGQSQPYRPPTPDDDEPLIEL